NRQHLLGDGQLIALESNSLSVFSTIDGSWVKTIALTGSGYYSAALGSKANVIIQNQDGSLSSISLTDGTRTWTSQQCRSGRIAVGNGKVYSLAQSKL